jgi:hypothetical protein
MMRNTWQSVAVLTIGLAMGASACGGASPSPTPAEGLPRIDASMAAPLDTTPETVGPPMGAASPRAAVERFLTAEIAGDNATSFALLADDERTDLGDAEAWAEEHADLPHYRSFTVVGGGDSGAGADATVTTDVGLEPSLDTVTGLVPARATVTWALVHEPSGWVVDLASSTFEPHFPDDAAAVPVVRAWLADGQACHAGEPLLGDQSAVDALCGHPGDVMVGKPRRLGTTPLDQDVVAAYGADAAGWARVLTVSGATTLRVVVAPVGDNWEVVAAAP